MMDTFSPATRRILAVGLLILACLLAVQWLALPLMNAIGEQREELAALRGRAAHLEAVRDRALPGLSALPAHAAIKASAAAPAIERLKMVTRQAAGTAGVNIRGMIAHPPSADKPQLLLLDVDVTGSEETLVRFIGLLERGEPLVRFESGHIQAGNAADQPMTLTGKLMAVWERQR